MPGEGYVRVVNWEQFQHYQTRNPPWIKLYNSLLDNYSWHRLPDASKAQLTTIWLLASRQSNFVVADPQWIASRCGLHEPPDLDLLVEHGFLERASEEDYIAERSASVALAERKQIAALETETETETELLRAFDSTWKEYPKRQGGNPRKTAFQKWKHVVTSGLGSPDELYHATVNYRRDCERNQRINTAYVLMGQTFFGPSERWRDFLQAPEPERKPGPQYQPRRFPCSRCGEEKPRGEFQSFNPNICIACDLAEKRSRHVGPSVRELIGGRPKQE